MVKNKIDSVTKVSLFNSREMRMKADIRRNKKVKKAIEFVKRMKKI